MKRPPDFETKLGGRTWTVRFVRKGHPKVRGCWGHCFRDDREIFVRYDLAQRTVRIVLAHEMLHATSDILFSAEEWVDHTSIELIEGMEKAGL